MARAVEVQPRAIILASGVLMRIGIAWARNRGIAECFVGVLRKNGAAAVGQCQGTTQRIGQEISGTLLQTSPSRRS